MLAKEDGIDTMGRPSVASVVDVGAGEVVCGVSDTVVVTVEKMVWWFSGIQELIEDAVPYVGAICDGLKDSWGVLLGCTSLAWEELWVSDTWELGIKGLAAVFTEPGTKECVADGRNFTVDSYCGDTKGDWDSLPEELFGSVWKPKVTGQPEW
jgi:hypothetical protein